MTLEPKNKCSRNFWAESVNGLDRIIMIGDDHGHFLNAFVSWDV